jgi:uncharacterized membrane protein (DUF373 family)
LHISKKPDILLFIPNSQRMKKISSFIEKAIINVLILLMTFILVLATFELGYNIVISLLESDYLLIDLDVMMDLFGAFLLVLIGIELLDTIKIYLRDNQVHVEVVVLVAIIALARKIVILKVESLEGINIIGIGILITSLSIAYYLIKKAGLMKAKLKDDTIKDKKQATANQNNE